jgi:hypothetical protein
MSTIDTDELSAVWERAERERAFCEAHRTELTRQYPDQFVAVMDEQVVDSDPDLYALAERLQDAGHELRNVWISFLRFRSPPWLL